MIRGQTLVNRAKKYLVMMNKALMHGLVRIGVLLSLWVSAAQAHAVAGYCHPQAALTITVPPITAPANPQVGQVLGSQDGYGFGNGSVVMQCIYQDWPFSWPVSGVLRIVNANHTGRTFNAGGLTLPVYSTDVAGVGVAMMARDPNRPWMSISHTGATLWDGKFNRPQYWGLDGRIYLVVTGPMSPGNITARTLAQYVVTNMTVTAPGFHSVNLSSVVINPPLKPTCSVTTPAISLPLGQVASRDFRGVGSYAGNATSYVRLSCSGGSGGMRDIYVTVTDQTFPKNRSDQLSLTPTSGARGVAIQLLSGNRLIRYGLDSSTVGNPNQWFVGSSGNGTVQIPLTARYVQTAPSIASGSANGLATFTMSYR